MRPEDSHQFPDPIRARELQVGARLAGMQGSLFLGQNGSQVVFWECTAEADVAPHSHDFDEYCVVVEGTCTETIDGREHILSKGDEILIPAGHVHSARISPPYRAIDFFGGSRFRYARDA
jgi:quercetin dioxygenase-like cupin family protein